MEVEAGVAEPVNRIVDRMSGVWLQSKQASFPRHYILIGSGSHESSSLVFPAFEVSTGGLEL
jgi:hypothetical protein